MTGADLTRLVVAVDGGQSGTVAVAGTLDGRVTGVGTGGPLRHHAEPGAAAKLDDALRSAVDGALAGSLSGYEVTVAQLSLTGSTTLAHDAIRRIVTADSYVVEGDAPAALASGTFGGPGVGLIAGTGTVAMAITPDGRRVQRGGWGWLLGDEGGGYWIGLSALRSAARAEDDVEPPGMLRKRMLDWFGCADMREVYHQVMGSEIDRTGIAALSPLVCRAAEDGDPAAAAILEAAGVELAALSMATLRAAPALVGADRRVVGCGGVLRAGGRVWRSLATALQVADPEVPLVRPTVAPVMGAFALALRQAIGPLPPAVVEQVSRSSGRFPTELGVSQSHDPEGETDV
jgi:glucosamine kinase